MMHLSKIWVIVILLACTYSCKEEGFKKKETTAKTLFTQISSDKSSVHFKNAITETTKFNILNYYDMYNGGGVAIADINNDGLQDIYFTSNQESNKLYLNKGDFKFEDITIKANVADAKGWTTGVTMIDINNDGWMDGYVCL